MIFEIILMIIGESSKDHWVIFTRSLQLIIMQALISIPISSLCLDFLKDLNKIAFYDLIGDNDVWSHFAFLKFNDNNVPFINQQMQTISFNTINAFIGLGTVSVYILAYFGQVALAMILKMFIYVTGEKIIKK